MQFQGTLNWVIANGYFFMFVLMLVEGPVVTAAGAFAAALGYFNIWIVFILSILGNFIPDIAYYAIGYWGREKIVEKHPRIFGVSKLNMGKLEHLLKKHLGKALTIIKLVPAIATPGLIIAGVAKVPLKKYAIWNAIIILPSSLFFLIVGFYFGSLYNKLNEYFSVGTYLVVLAIIIFIVISYLYGKISQKFAEKIEESD
jgi:membrane protein DedA with SNARE-associated domain